MIESLDLIRLYNRRQLEYARYKDLYPAETEPLKSTLFWEIGRLLLNLTGSANAVVLTIVTKMVMDWTSVVLGEALKAEEVLKN